MARYHELVRYFLFAWACATAMWAQQTGNLSVTSPKVQVPPITNRDEIVLTVGERKITAGQFEDLVKMFLPPQSQPVALGAGRRVFAQKLAELFALADEAQRVHLNQDPGVALRLQYQMNTLLGLDMIQQLNQTLVVPEADINAWYEAHKSDYEILHARHILIRVKGAPSAATAGKPELSDEEALSKAQSIRKRLVAGEDFETLAKAESDDAAEKGGNLGEVKRGVMVAQFEKAAFALKTGEFSEPVRSPYGYHIIQVQSRSISPLSEVKQDVIAHVRPLIGPKLVAELVNKAAPSLDDKFFGPAPAVDPAAPSPGK